MAKGNLVEIKFDERKLKRIQRAPRGIPKKLPWVLKTAINKTADTGHTKIAKHIASELNPAAKKAKFSHIKKAITKRKATNRRLFATLNIGDRRIPLIEFGTRKSKKGVSYQIGKRWGRGVLEHAFKTKKMKFSRKNIFMRRGTTDKLDEMLYASEKLFGGKTGRLPIYKIWGPSIAYLYENVSNINEEMMVYISTTLEKNIDSQLAYVLGMAKGARSAG